MADKILCSHCGLEITYLGSIWIHLESREQNCYFNSPVAEPTQEYYQEYYHAEKQEAEEAHVEADAYGQVDRTELLQASGTESGPEASGQSGESTPEAEVTNPYDLMYANIYSSEAASLEAVSLDLRVGALSTKYIDRRIKQLRLNASELRQGKPMTSIRYSG